MLESANRGGVARLWRRAVRLGIDDDIPETQAKFIVLANIGAYVSILVNLPYLGVVWSSRSTVYGAMVFTYFAAMAAGLWIRWRRLHWLGTTFLFVVTLAWTTASVAVFGSASLGHLYFVAIAVAAIFLYPPTQTRTMWVLSVTAAAAFVLSFFVAPANSRLALQEDADVDRIMTLVGFTILVCAIAYYQRQVVQGVERKLDEERARSESLLLNVLPKPIAARLKDDTRIIADSVNDATVLFADLVGFTVLASKLPPEQVVEMLNKAFQKFDDLAEKHGLEKIKTMGDAYMVAGGLLTSSEGHAQQMAQMALEMLEVVRELKTPTGDLLNARIGIASGPVVAGVIGRKKFAYDLWGDTVNTASRMESHGAPGRVQVTSAVFERLKDHFDFEPRGPITVKGKGEMPTWWLVRPRTAEGGLRAASSRS